MSSVGSSSKTLSDGLKKLGDTPLGKQAQVDAERLHKSIEALRAGQERFASTAKLAASGLDAIGGPARLTKQQLDEMNKVVLQGLDAFRALGRQAPAELTKVSQAIQRQQATLGGTQGGIFRRIFGEVGSEIATVAAGFVTGTALIAGVKTAFDSLVGAAQGAIRFASQLDDLSKATNISVENLQELGFAGKRVGLDLNQIGDLVGTLAKRIGTGDAGATSAVQSLGLSLKDLKALAPDRLFTVLAEAVARIQDPLAQAGIGSELFGRQFQAALKLANDGLDGTRQEARNLGAVLSEESVKKLDAFGDKVGDITTVLKVLAADALTPVITGLTDFLALSDRASKATFINPEVEKEFARERNAFEKFNKEFQEFLANRATQQQSQSGVAVPFSQTNPLGGPALTIVGDQAKALAAGGLVITQADLIANRLRALRTNALEPLTATQQRHIVSLLEWGVNEKEVAGLVGASEQAVHRYAEAIKKGVGEQKKYTDAVTSVLAASKGYGAILASVDVATQVAIRHDLALGKSKSELALFYKVTETQVDAVSQSIAVETTLIGLNTTATIANASALANLGRLEIGELALIKESQAAREQLNSAMAIDPSALAGLRLVSQFDIATIPLLLKQVALREQLRKLAQNPNEVGAFNAGATGLETIGFQNQILSPQQIQQLAEAEQRSIRIQGLLSALSGGFAELAQISGDTFPAVARDVGQVISALNLASEAAKGFSSTSKLEMAAASATYVGLAIQLGLLFAKAISGAETRRISSDLGRDFGRSFSDGVAKGIRESERQLQDAQIRGLIAGGIDAPVARALSQLRSFRGAATALNLGAIIQDAGGVDAFGFTKATEEARKLFSFLERGELTVQQVGKAFDDVFAQLVPSALSKVSGLVSAAFSELQQIAIRFDVKSPELEAFRASQTDQISGALEGFFKNAQVKSQAAASALGGAFAAQFEELSRQGVSLLDIIDQLAPSIEAFRRQLQKTGFDGGAAFKDILGLADLIKDKIAGPALQSISELGKVLAGLANTGGLNQDIFGGFTDQIGKTIADLIAKGIDPNKITLLLAPTLQTLFELQERGFIITDETAKKLLDQAIADGRVGEKFKSAAERTVSALDKLNVNHGRTNQILESIANKLGARTIVVPYAPPPVLNPPGRPTVPAATGGLVTHYGIQHFAEGGRVSAPMAHIQYLDGGGQAIRFQRQGTDTVPAMLTPGELVLTVVQQRLLAQALVNPSIVLPRPLQTVLQRFESRLTDRRSVTATPVAQTLARITPATSRTTTFPRGSTATPSTPVLMPPIGRSSPPRSTTTLQDELERLRGGIVGPSHSSSVVQYFAGGGPVLAFSGLPLTRDTPTATTPQQSLLTILQRVEPRHGSPLPQVAVGGLPKPSHRGDPGLLFTSRDHFTVPPQAGRVSSPDGLRVTLTLLTPPPVWSRQTSVSATPTQPTPLLQSSIKETLHHLTQDRTRERETRMSERHHTTTLIDRAGSVVQTIAQTVLGQLVPSLAGDLPWPVFAATGGQVTTSGLQYFPEGGRVLPFLSKGSDSVPAMLTPGEVVLNAAQQEAISTALGSQSGRAIHLQAQVVMDRRVVGEAVFEYAASEGRQKANTLVKRAS